jgi:site-specific DNA-methyltransferase (adenine-specific)
VRDFDVQHRDAFESLAAMRDAGGVDLILTSPPYPDARTDEAYGASFDTSLEGYARLGNACFAALKPGGVCALNIDGPVRKWRGVCPNPLADGAEIGSERSLVAFEVALDWAKRVGFRFVEHCAYVRDGFPISEGPRWRSGGEPLHVFARPGADPHFDRYGSTRKAKYAGAKQRPPGHGSRDVNGKRKQATPGRPVADRRSVMTFERHAGHTDSEHVAPFASTLADDYVLCYSPPGGLVGDPFVGSGTVAFACHRHGRRFIGGDIGIRQTHRGKPCGRRWSDIVSDGLSQQRLFGGES